MNTSPSGYRRSSPFGAGRVAVAATIVVVGLVILTGLRRGPAAVSPGVSDTTAPRAIAGGPFEPSGVANVPGSDYVLFVDDGRTREIFLMQLAADGKQVGTASAIPIDADVTDLEGITSDGRHFYTVGSQSKKTGFEGDGIVRFTFDPRARRVTSVERIRGLKVWLADHVAELKGTGQQVGDEVLNIEAIAWDPAGRRLLLGLRAPQVGGDALIIPIALADSAGAFSRENLRLDGQTIRLPLNGAGIRSLEYDATRHAFLVITGAGPNAENLDFRVLEWSGKSGAPLRHLATYSSELKPEGFTRAVIGGRNVSVIVFDVGSFSVIY